MRSRAPKCCAPKFLCTHTASMTGHELKIRRLHSSDGGPRLDTRNCRKGKSFVSRVHLTILAFSVSIFADSETLVVSFSSKRVPVIGKVTALSSLRTYVATHGRLNMRMTGSISSQSYDHDHHNGMVYLYIRRCVLTLCRHLFKADHCFTQP